MATTVLLDDQVYDLSFASSGVIDATETVAVCPSLSDSVVWSSVMPVTYCLTSTSQVLDIPLPSCALAVIVAVPLDTLVTTPEDETVATDVFELDQVKFRLSADSGKTEAVIVAVLPL